MKKNGIVFLFTVVLFAIVAVASDIAFEVLVSEENSERAYVPATDSDYTSVEDPMYALLKSVYGEGEVLWEVTEKYAEFKATDKPTKEEMVAIYASMEKTNDISAAMEVYRFWERTNDSINVYTGIMDRYTSNLSKTKYWYEDVYNELTNNVHGVLDVKDVEKFIGDGIASVDISVANVLSRRGIYTITEILDLRKENKSWAYIAAQIFSEYDYNPAHDEISGIDVLDAQYLEKRTDNSMAECFDIAIEEGSLTLERQKYFNISTAGVRDMLIAAKLWDYSEEEKQNMEIRRQGIIQTAEANGISREAFAALEAEGESEMDILNASLVVKEKGVTAEQAVIEVKTKEGVIDR